ncbi:MAG: prepilin-type N-terminal cleavage/methylation domain-containing protein [Betaproteobacteria bacterium]|nr:prepilin-type N-terminal cleavage/methylation domain-containing protein [Betaproteobacteria bacterium]
MSTRIHAPRIRGFTLLELLVVLVIIATAASLAALALPRSTKNTLDQDSARLAALLDDARSYANAVQAPVRLEPTPGGYRFVGIVAGTWQELGDELRPRQFTTPGAASDLPAGGVVLGPEPVGDAVTITLSASGDARVVHSDGVSPFIVGGGAS